MVNTHTRKKRETEKYELETLKSQNPDNKKKGSFDKNQNAETLFFQWSNLIINKKQLKIQTFFEKLEKKNVENSTKNSENGD